MHGDVPKSGFDSGRHVTHRMPVQEAATSRCDVEQPQVICVGAHRDELFSCKRRVDDLVVVAHHLLGSLREN